MKKTKSYIKIIVYVISALGFLDLLINPKPIEFFDSKLNLVASIMTIVGLTILTLKEIRKDNFGITGKFIIGIKIALLMLFMIYINAFLKRFNFIQIVEYIIVIYHTLPVIFIINDLTSKKIKSKYLAISGMILLIPTLIYFGFVYEPYDGYWNETPILFIHQHIRNLICYFGIALILTSIIRSTHVHPIKTE